MLKEKFTTEEGPQHNLANRPDLRCSEIKKAITKDRFFVFCVCIQLGCPANKWRRVRDSNPRAPRRAASFQDWCIQPLYQLSVDRSMGFDVSYQAVVVMTHSIFKTYTGCEALITLFDFGFTAHVLLKRLWNCD